MSIKPGEAHGLWQQEDPEFWAAYLEGRRPLPERRTPHWDDALPLLGSNAKRISRTTELTPENLAADLTAHGSDRLFSHSFHHALTSAGTP